MHSPIFLRISFPNNTRSQLTGQTKSNYQEDLGSSPLHPCGGALRPSDDRDLAVVESLAVDSFLSLKNPKTGREHTGTLSTTGATRTPDEYDRSTARDRDFDAAWKLHGELELRSRPWNTILPEEFMRGESTERQRGGEGRRRAGLRLARLEVEWRWEERTRRMRGGLGSTESRERRGMSSWSWPEEDDEESEKREEARERDASESELSRRSGAEERSDAAAPDARPLFRWSRSFKDLAAAEFVVLAAVFAGAAGDGEGFGL